MPATPAPRRSGAAGRRGQGAVTRSETDRGGEHWVVKCCALFIFVAVGRLTEVLPLLGNIPVVKILAGAALLGMFLDPGLRSAATASRSVIARLVSWIIVLATLGVATSIWRSQSLTSLTSSLAVVGCLFFLVYKTAVHESAFQLYIDALAWSAVVLIAASLFLGTTVESTGRLQARVSYDANDLAFVLVIILPLLLAKYRLSSGLWAGVWVTASIAAVAVILKTQSRGGIIGLIVMLGALGAISVWKKEISSPRVSLALRGLALFSLVALPLFFSLPEDARDRISSIWSLSSDYNTNLEDPDSRLAIWKRGLTVLASRPWGVGIGAYGAAEGGLGGRYHNAHNFIVQVLVELGLVGFLLYTLAFVQMFRILRMAAAAGASTEPESPSKHRSRLYAQHLICSLLGFIFAGLFLSQGYSTVLFVFFGLAAAVEARRSVTAKRIALNR